MNSNIKVGIHESTNQYVYSYHDKEGVTVYVGAGCKGRAWHVGYMKGDTQERHDWKQEQLDLGRLPCDWVEIYERGLTRKESKVLEVRLIEQLRPKLNRFHNPDYKATNKYDLIKEAMLKMRLEGCTYSTIAKELNIPSPSTVWRHVNG